MESQNQFESIPQKDQHVISISIICHWKWQDYNVSNKVPAHDVGNREYLLLWQKNQQKLQQNKLRNSEYVIRNATLMHLPMHGHNKMQTMQTE